MKALFNEDYNDIDFERFRDNKMINSEITNLIVSDIMRKEGGRDIAPDTIGVDFFLLLGFMNEDMEIDFPIIEQDFLKNCRSKLEEFHNVGWYGEKSFQTDSPYDAMNSSVLRLIYNGAKMGDEYCVELFKTLYKLYHKKEYNQLKRFKTINAEEILSLSQKDSESYDNKTIGRILGMCPFFSIEIKDDCSFLYSLLKRRRNRLIDLSEEGSEFITISQELFDECSEQVDVWLDEQKNLSYRKKNKTYRAANEFTGTCFRSLGYIDDYPMFCAKSNIGLRIIYIRTLALLKIWRPKREFDFEEVQIYANIYYLVTSITDIVDFMDLEMSYLFGEEIEEEFLEESLFKPNSIKISDSKGKKEIKTTPNVAPIKQEDVSEEAYIKEIADLRRKLSEQEKETKYLREQLRTVKKDNEEKSNLIGKYENERSELIALREFAYKLEHEEPEIEEDNLPEMKQFIAEKKLIIIGGSPNWQNKLRNEFPNWTFVNVNNYRTFDAKMLENQDKVYFFTDHISHASYRKFIAVVRENNIPFGYIASSNIEAVIRQIYGEMMGTSE